MIFSSLTFLFAFLPLTLALYFVVPMRARNSLLLIVSLLFYAWGEGPFIWVMALSIVMNWLLGRAIQDASPGARNALCGVGVAANLLLLGGFKYANFFADAANNLLSDLNASFRLALSPIHLPIGISFFTFQAISYLIDIYRRTEVAERNLFRAGLYISLFPQLIAGPIVRYADVAQQIRVRQVTLEGFVSGLERFTMGLAKKVLLANTFAVAADRAFAAPVGLGMLDAWVGLAAYTFQIYFDFSGYSDMAIGLGRMFGFNFLENFNYPYTSHSITEFWRRWHISLSSWFRDYLYKPLGGNRRGPMRTYFNLWVVFVLCGLWHGAAWNFLVWGMLHGAFLVLERMFLKRVLEKSSAFGRIFGHVYTALVVMLAWVFFRAESLPKALEFLGSLFSFGAVGQALPMLMTRKLIFAFAVAILAMCPVIPILRERFVNSGSRIHPIRFATALSLLGLFCFSVMSLASGTHNPFIYFRF